LNNVPLSHDSGFVLGGEGAQLENTCAVCLLQHVQYQQDVTGKDIELHYIKTKEGKEVDFVLSQKGRATHLIEVKLSDDAPSSSLALLAKKIPEAKAFQLVQNLRREQQIGNISILNAAKWIGELSA